MFCEQPINLLLKFSFANLDEARSMREHLKLYENDETVTIVDEVKSRKPRTKPRKRKLEISSLTKKQSSFYSREKRLQRIERYLYENRKKSFTSGKLYRNLSKKFTNGYKTFQRDISILILQGRIEGERTHMGQKGVTTIIKHKEEGKN